MLICEELFYLCRGVQHGQGEEQFGNHLGRQRVLFVIEPTVMMASELQKHVVVSSSSVS